MKTYELPKEINDLESQLVGLRETYNKAQAEMMAVSQKKRELFSEFAMETFNAADDKLAHMLLPMFYDAGVEYMRAANAFLWHTYGTNSSGHNPVTNQRLPQLAFYKHSDGARNANMRRLIEDALPHMIPFADGMKDYYNRDIDTELHGFCLFSTIEHTLSEHGSINLYVSHDKKVMVSVTRYSCTHYTNVMDFDEGIDYFIQNHYYEDLSQHTRDED